LGDKIEWRCIYALLEVEPEDDLVLKENYIRFLSFFSPVRTGFKEGTQWLIEIKLLLSQKWFHGPIDKTAALNRISAQETKRSIKNMAQHGGGFIVRFSNVEKAFTMTYKKPKEKKCANIRLDPTRDFLLG